MTRHLRTQKNSNIFSVVYKLITILSLTIGITLTLYKSTSIPSQLSYYTTQSNIINLAAFIWFISFDFNQKEKNNFYYIVKGLTLIAILITLLVYHLALAPIGFEMDSLQHSIDNRTIIKSISNFFVHTLSPILVIVDYFLFDKKGHFKWHYPFFWLGYPVFYVIYVYIYAFSGGTFFSVGGSRQFAYFFLDYKQIGFIAVAKWIIFAIFAILGLSYMLVVFDSKIKSDSS